jgi:hypothetical protein
VTGSVGEVLLSTATGRPNGLVHHRARRPRGGLGHLAIAEPGRHHGSHPASPVSPVGPVGPAAAAASRAHLPPQAGERREVAAPQLLAPDRDGVGQGPAAGLLRGVLGWAARSEDGAHRVELVEGLLHRGAVLVDDLLEPARAGVLAEEEPQGAVVLQDGRRERRLVDPARKLAPPFLGDSEDPLVRAPLLGHVAARRQAELLEPAQLPVDVALGRRPEEEAQGAQRPLAHLVARQLLAEPEQPEDRVRRRGKESAFHSGAKTKGHTHRLDRS